MSKRLGSVLTTAAALVLGLGPVASPASAAGSIPIYTHADNGKTEHLAVGTKFKVRLKGCGDCGDTWSFKQKPDPHVVKVLGRNVYTEAQPPAVGGYDHTVWTMRVVGNGTTTMRMVERSASQNNKVIKRFSLTIQVTPVARSG